MIFLILNSEDALLIEMLYSKYSKFMYKVAYNILHNKYDTEDAIQQTIVRIISCIEKIGEIEDKKTRNFIGIVCRNIAIDIYNKRKKHTDVYDINDCEDITVDDNDLSLIVVSQDNVEKIERFISSLDKKYQDVLFLRIRYEYNISEIASILGLSYDTAQKRLERGRNKLKKFLLEEMNKNE